MVLENPARPGGGFHQGWEGKREIQEESQVLGSDPIHLLRWASRGQEQIWGAGGSGWGFLWDIQSADSRPAIRPPHGELRGASGQAHLGIRSRGPGCALGGKASREGQDMPTEWEPCGECHRGRTGVPVIGGWGTGRMEGLEALASTGAGGEAWRLWEGWLFPGAWPEWVQD